MMRTAARAIAWEFRARHRWGLIALAGYFLVLATIKLLILRGERVHFDGVGDFALVVIVPITATFLYALVVFTFGFDGHVAARQSMYPARKFTLPVTTAALAGWPMLYGTAAMMILWLATRLLAAWPVDVEGPIEVPVVWPALLAAALVAWAQAFMWMPYPLPGLRVAATVLWLVTFDTIVLLALEFKAPEPVMLAILAPQVPLAYLAARFAVARARRGDVPDWGGAFAGLGRLADRLRQRRGHFASPERAQAWLEWQRHGRTLPGWIAILLPFELALLWAAGSSTTLVFVILVGVLITPPFMAAFTAATVAKANPSVSDAYGLSPFVATRPLTSAALIAAKLKATLWSTAAAWVLVLVAIPLALRWSGTWPIVAEKARQVSEEIGTPRATVFVLLVLAWCIASTLKQLVQGLFIGLTGRERLIKGSVLVAVAVFCGVGPLAQWIHDDANVRVAIWNALPWGAAVLCCAKVSAAAWVAARLHRGRLLSDRALVAGAAWWLVAVLALYAVFAWLVSGPLVPHYFLVLLAILAIPLARVSAAPLALAWNRHR